MKIRMTNWRCFADQTFDLGPCSFIVGRNGSGKTSVVHALEFAFTGTGALLGARTKIELAAEAIRDDFGSCEVIVEIGATRIRRTMDRDGKQTCFRSVFEQVLLEDKEGKLSRMPGTEGGWSNEEALQLKRDQGNPFADVPNDLTRCMLDPTHFFSLEAQRRQEILVNATSDPEVTEERAKEALDAVLSPEADADTDAIKDAARWVAELGFRGAEAAAVDRRKVAKRERDLLVVGDEPEPMFLVESGREIDLSDHPLEKHSEMLAAVRARHIEAVRMESAGSGALSGKLVEAEQALAALRELPVPPPDGDLIERHTKATDALAALLCSAVPEIPNQPADDALAVANGIHEDAKRALAKSEGLLEDMGARVCDLEAEGAAKIDDFPRPTICPKGPAGMRCPVGPQGFEKVVEKALGDPEARATEILQIKAEAQTIDAKIAEQTAAVGVASATFDSIREGAGAGKEAVRAVQAREAAISDAEAHLGAAERSVEESTEQRRHDHAEAIGRADARVAEARQAFEKAQEGEKPSGPSSETLEKKIALGERVVEASRVFWSSVETRDAMIVDRFDADVRVKRWDAICQQLKPDGIETKLGGDAREVFEKSLADVADLAGPIHLDSECGITVDLDREDFPRRQLQLSNCQLLAVGVAIQHALCQLQGFPILVVDAVDSFDRPHLEAFIKLAVGSVDKYPGGILGLATTKKEPPASSPAPWATFWLKPDSTVERFEPVQPQAI